MPKKYLVAGAIIFFSLLAVVSASMAYLNRYDKNNNQPREQECGGAVAIYVNNLEKSAKSLKESFKLNSWIVRYEEKRGEYRFMYDVKMPFGETKKFADVIRKEASDDVVYGEKALYEGVGDDYKGCKNYVADLVITDVKAL